MSREIGKLIDQTYNYKKLSSEYGAKYELGRRKLQKLMSESESNMESTTSFETKTLKAVKVETVNVNYDLEKLEQKLDKELLDLVIIKDISIINMDGVKKLLQKYGVPAKEFMKLIHVTKKVDKGMVKKLYSEGEITKKELDGTYEATVTIRVDIKEKKETGD